MHNSLCPPPLFGPPFMMCPVNRACALTVLPLSRPVGKILEYFAGSLPFVLFMTSSAICLLG